MPLRARVLGGRGILSVLRATGTVVVHRILWAKSLPERLPLLEGYPVSDPFRVASPWETAHARCRTYLPLSASPRVAAQSSIGGRSGHLPRRRLHGRGPGMGLRQHEHPAPPTGRSGPPAAGDPAAPRGDPHQGRPHAAHRGPEAPPLPADRTTGHPGASRRAILVPRA